MNAKKNNVFAFRLDDELDKEIQGFLQLYKGKKSKASLIRAALNDFVNRDIKDIHLTSHNVQRLAERFENLEETVKVFIDFFAFFVQAWFAHTPELPDNKSKIAMWEQAASRLEKLCTSFKNATKDNSSYFVKSILNYKNRDPDIIDKK
jgi:hypothetical protein